MKQILIPALALVLAGSAFATGGVRVFHSADDPSASFEGTLTGYNKETKIVTVRIKGGATTSFPLDKLNDSDREYILSKADAIAAGQDLKFDFKEWTNGGSKKDQGGTRTSVRLGGFDVTLRNWGKQAINDVKVRTTLFVRRDAERGPSQVQQEVKEYQITQIGGGLSRVLKTEEVPLERVLKRGDAGC